MITKIPNQHRLPYLSQNTQLVYLWLFMMADNCLTFTFDNLEISKYGKVTYAQLGESMAELQAFDMIELISDEPGYPSSETQMCTKGRIIAK